MKSERISSNIAIQSVESDVGFVKEQLAKLQGRKVTSKVAEAQTTADRALLLHRLSLASKALGHCRGDEKTKLEKSIQLVTDDLQGLGRQITEEEINAPPTVGHAVPGKPIDCLIDSPALALTDQEKEQGHSIIGKIGRTEAENSFSYADLQSMQKLRSEMELQRTELARDLGVTTIAESFSDEQNIALRDLTQMITLLQEGEKEVGEAVASRLQLIKEADWLGSEVKVAETLAAPTSFDSFEKVHDLFWRFEAPYNTAIGFQDFHELLSHADEFDVLKELGISAEQLEVAKALSDQSKELSSLAKGENYRALCQTEGGLAKVVAHKDLFLRQIRQEALNARGEGKREKVVIAGAGPGGLMRGIVGRLVGVETEVYDKRADGRNNERLYTRRNMIVLGKEGAYLPGIELIGLHERMLLKGDIDTSFDGNHPIEASISNLQKGLADVMHKVLDAPPVRPGAFAGVDIRARPGEDSGSETVALMESDSGVEMVSCDRLVDATGAVAASSSIFGVERETFEEPINMCTIVVNKKRSGGAIAKPDESVGGKPDSWLNIKLADPEQDYLLISLEMETHEELSELNEQIALQKGLAEDPATAGQAKLELERLVEQKNKIVRNVGIRAGEIMGFGEFSEEDILEMSSFVVEVGKRNPTDYVADMWVMRSGDSLHTPDPLSSGGAMMAIWGAKSFAAALSTPSGSSHAGYHTYMYAMNKESDRLIGLATGGF